MRVAILLFGALFFSTQAFASTESGLLIPGSVATQNGPHVQECGVRLDGTLYARVVGLSYAGIPSNPTPIVRYRLHDKSGRLMFDEFVPTASDSTAEKIFFGRNTSPLIGKVSCSIAATEDNSNGLTVMADNELRTCDKPHYRDITDLGLDYDLRALAIAPSWAAVRFYGWFNAFMNPKFPAEMNDARFFTRMDGGKRADALLNGDNATADVLYPGLAGSSHILDFGTDDEGPSPPNDFTSICFVLPTP
ncbi:MAG: hypothetical protein JO165_01975 [Candidatus Eremiobacteraeota bacterium]|nr:hypothetical protein [Candidatus Eremiobacteraeota bacterium]